MSIFTAGIYNQLANDSTLTALLTDYNGVHAIFTIEPIPGDADYPYIVISQVTMTPDDTKSTQGREILWDVRCYTEATGTKATVESIAEQVRSLLHRYALVITGYTTIVAEVSNIIDAPQEDGVYGIILTTRFRTEAN